MEGLLGEVTFHVDLSVAFPQADNREVPGKHQAPALEEVACWKSGSPVAWLECQVGRKKGVGNGIVFVPSSGRPARVD